MGILNGQKLLEKVDELDEVTEDFVIRVINKVEAFLDRLPWWLGWLKRSKRLVQAVEDVLLEVIDLVEKEVKKRKGNGKENKGGKDPAKRNNSGRDQVSPQ
jgi:hypothetical protein